MPSVVLPSSATGSVASALGSAPGSGGPDWRISRAPVAYDAALAFMDARAAAIRAGQAPDCVWLLSHPPLYTAGTRADPRDLLWPDRFPVYHSGRGGQFTYHGPGQRIAYVLMDLSPRGRDVRRFVRDLEAWIIAALARLGVRGERRDGRTGIWVAGTPDGGGGGGEAKIAAIGVRVRRWVTLHGLAVNVAPDLGHFAGIVPCGLRDHGVTSLAALGVSCTEAEMDRLLQETFCEVFGPGRAGESAGDAASD